MPDKKHDKVKSFPEVEAALRETYVRIDNMHVPVLNGATVDINIKCFGGKILDIKPLLRFT